MKDIFEAKVSKVEETGPKPQLSDPTSMDDVHEINSPTPTFAPTPTAEKKLPASSVLGLFDDDDDSDDGDLFGSKFVANPSNNSKDQREKENQQSKPVAVASKTSLFGDHDNDDDDLFGPPPLHEPTKQPQPKKVNQKIFSDDSSDDDLFGGGGKKTAQKIPSKPSAGSSSTSSSTSTIPKIMKNTKASDKLFSDSEDDDLFGGSKLKSTGKSNPFRDVQFTHSSHSII